MAVDADDGADENVDIQNGSLSKFMANVSPPQGSSSGQFYGWVCNLLKKLIMRAFTIDILGQDLYELH